MSSSPTTDVRARIARLLQRELDVAGILAVLITVGFFALVFVLALRQAPIDNRDILNIVVGMLGAGWGAVVQYYYGSSKGRDALGQQRPADAPAAEP